MYALIKCIEISLENLYVYIGINKVLLTKDERRTLSGVFIGAIFINGREKYWQIRGKIKNVSG